MKKILLSATVLISFVLFSVYQRKQNELALPATAPVTTQDTQNNPQSSFSDLANPQSSPTASPIPETQTLHHAAVNTPTSGYRDGTYTGDATDAFYGNIQIAATFHSGKLTDVQFLQYPNDRGRSIAINTYAMPILRQEAIQAQSADVDIVSGATDSSRAFMESLQSALIKAKS